MARTALLIDSTTNVPAEYLELEDVHVLHVPIYANGKEYRDGIDITPEQFCRLLEASRERPSTAVPGIGEFVALYEDLLSRYDSIIFPTPSAHLSGVLNAAVLGARQLDGVGIVVVDGLADVEGTIAIRSSDPLRAATLSTLEKQTGPHIAIVNSDFAAGGTGLVGLAGWHAIVEGKALPQALEAMVQAKSRTGLYFILNTFDYVVDRVGEMKAFLGTLLNIKPVLSFRNGVLEDAARVRGERKAAQRMVEVVKERVQDRLIDAYVLHAVVPERAAELAHQVQQQFNVRHLWTDVIGAAVSRYTGSGGLAIGFTEVDDG